VRLACLGSGSKGNATLVASRQCRLLIDCGLTLREFEQRAASLDFDPATLDAVLVTHEHGDHIGGVSAVARRYGVPVYLTHGTAAAGRLRGPLDLRRFNADTTLQIGDMEIDAVAVPHDAREPVQYRLSNASGRVGILTDLGHVTPHVRAAFRSCDLLMLEFNHDRAMLEAGPYPAALKRRVGGDWGHLSNTQALDLLCDVDAGRLARLVIAHMSEQNNCPERVREQLAARAPAVLARTVLAQQGAVLPWLEFESLASSGSLAAY
jgi:phosphoribosyl 1,2-cyclic phosphodiesterase